jgi:hypothetical protein
MVTLLLQILCILHVNVCDVSCSGCCALLLLGLFALLKGSSLVQQGLQSCQSDFQQLIPHKV